MFFLSPGLALADVTEKLRAGDKALAGEDLATAERAYADALKLEPDNYRILKSLAEVKADLGKYKEAETLIDKVVAMKVINGRMVRVTRKGETGSREAELVDETVLLDDRSKNNMRNYLATVHQEPIPHYRLFYIKSGKMELVPKSDVTIQYLGVPGRVHELAVVLQAKVKNKVMAASESQGPEEMVSVKGGCFRMGSGKGEVDEQPVHEVCVSSFQIDKYEVIQQAFSLKMGSNPSRFKGPNLPVESVTWVEASDYCLESGKRLPTEAEWEYAARGGTTTRYYWGDEFDPEMANLCDSSCELNIRTGGSDGFKHTAPVGSFPPNPLGLHDMAGNVNEWVWDWREANYYVLSPKDNPKGPVRQTAKIIKGGTSAKMLRGGSWENDASQLRSASRRGLWPDYRIEGVGFRCAADS